MQPKLKSFVQEARQPLLRLVLWATEASGPLAVVACIGRETQSCYTSVLRGQRFGDVAADLAVSVVTDSLLKFAWAALGAENDRESPLLPRYSVGCMISAIPRTLEVAEDASTARSSRFSEDAAVPRCRGHLRRFATLMPHRNRPIGSDYRFRIMWLSYLGFSLNS